MDNVDTPTMTALGQETTGCEEGEGTGNDAKFFAIVVVVGGDKSIQAAQ